MFKKILSSILIVATLTLTGTNVFASHEEDTSTYEPKIITEAIDTNIYKMVSDYEQGTFISTSEDPNVDIPKLKAKIQKTPINHIKSVTPLDISN